MTSRDYRRTTLPYGLWVCADGREVLFNRDYAPLWQRVGGVVLVADPEEWVSWRSQVWFYDDGQTEKHAALCRRLEKIFAAFCAGQDVTAAGWKRVAA